MNHALIPGIADVLAAVDYRPAVSIILPFNPKMTHKSEITHSLKCALDTANKILWAEYPQEVATLVTNKLKAITANLNYSTHKKSIAIYVSPVFEKVFYLDMEMEPTVNVGDTFDIKDLLESRKTLQDYLVLVLGGKECRILHGSNDSLQKIVSDVPSTVYAYVNELPQKVSNFSDADARKEHVMEKFLHQMDISVGIILNAYQLPLFVLGTERLTGHFKKITNHAASVVSYIHGNYEHASVEDIQDILTPHISDWEHVRSADILHQLEEAENSKRLSSGIPEVWQQALLHKGKLLILERDYSYETANNIAFNKFSPVRDKVGDAIEKVLENGGDVAFVENGMLKNYDHIAMIQYY